MILINKITPILNEAFQKDLMECLIKNSDVGFISNIVVFYNNTNIVLPKNNKVKLVVKNGYTDKEIIEYCKRIYNDEIFIFANPFAIFNNSLIHLDKTLKVAIKSEDYYIFNKNHKFNNNQDIDNIFQSTDSNNKISTNTKNIWIKSDFKKSIVNKPRISVKNKERINNYLSKIKEQIKEMPNIDIIIVSVDYNDILPITLSSIPKEISVTVVTTSSDLECQRICIENNVKFVVSDRIYEDDADFNKGKAINDGIKSIVNPEWILLLDSDIYLKDDFIDILKSTNLTPKDLFICKRLIVNDNESFERWKNGEDVGKMERAKGYGFFHLFNIKSVRRSPIFPENYKDASFSDLEFRDSFKSKKELDTYVVHLGTTNQNWTGRKSEKFNETGVLKMSKRDNSIKPKLAVLTTFFNPNNYINLKYNYMKFSEKIKEKCDLFTIELSFNGEFYIDDEKSIRILGDSNNILWQKERLLNILLDKIPNEYTNIAWIDCDILFDNEDWVEEVNEKLKYYKVLHLYEYADRLSNNGDIEKKSTSIIKRISDINKVDINLSLGIPGFGWAIRRECIDKIKFLDTQIIGGGDSLMFYSFFGITNGFVSNQMNEEWFNTFKLWSENAYKEIDSSVSYITGRIKHLYHGEMTDRKYNTRYKILSENKFNPNIDLVLTENGLWEMRNKSILENLSNYFTERNEDSNIIDINDYFDKIYVINLDRRPDRHKNIKNKLNSLNIKYKRFSAIDGNLIDENEYDFSKFEQGKGMIENKYALACLRSHMSIIKEAKKKKYKRILIFEDDVMISKDIKVHLQKLRNIKEWKMIYLGSSQYDWNVEFIEDFFLSKKSLGTFAYALDESLYDEILNSEINKSIDNILSDIQSKHKGECFTFYPNICIADVSESEIRGSRDNKKHSEKMRWNLLNNYV